MVLAETGEQRQQLLGASWAPATTSFFPSRNMHAASLHHIPFPPCSCAADTQPEQHNQARAGARHRTAHPTACLAVSSALLALSTSDSSCRLNGMDGLQDTVISVVVLRDMFRVLRNAVLAPVVAAVAGGERAVVGWRQKLSGHDGRQLCC